MPEMESESCANEWRAIERAIGQERKMTRFKVFGFCCANKVLFGTHTTKNHFPCFTTGHTHGARFQRANRELAER